ncbi:hypothetical protein MSMAL_1717 [Methanosarcina mazei LYC]|uniref:Uncharacterized protein n=1 Tax=Methanosarcina mazei LYC TaxID=1434114 RepID=A0A0E3RPF1_METMZ|nr:hypothetical protein MSMAL_1717 [Methanosarcina mazei LYC]
MLNGVPVEDLELSEKQKEVIRKWIPLSSSGKSVYQIAQEIEVGSYLCSELHRTKKQHKKAYLSTVGKYKKTAALKQNEADITETELINFLKSKKTPVTASVCAKWLGLPVRAAFYRLQVLEQAGKVIKVKKNGFTQWAVTA